MTYKLFGAGVVAGIVALAWLGIVAAGVKWILPVAALTLLLAWLWHWSVRKPLNAVDNGIYLLKALDFPSRLRLTGQPDADRVVRLFNSLMDTLKQERLRSQEQNRFLAQLVDVSPLGIAICNFEGSIIDTNPAFDKFMTPELKEALNSLKIGESATFRQGEGQVFRLSRLWFMDSGFRRCFLLVERLTEEIATAERNLFCKIVRSIGHEVNNTLGSVGSVLDTLAEIHAGEPMVRDTIGSCSRSCTHLVEFVRGYADVVKLPAPELCSVDLREELPMMLPTLRGIAPQGIAVELEMPQSGALGVMADMMLMERVMVNLVKNAVESILARGENPPEPGRVVIALSPRTIEVRDNGAGISPEAATRLFTPFFSTKRPDRGLGLMLVGEILRGHNATFRLCSPTPSLTTFTITFPR